MPPPWNAPSIAMITAGWPASCPRAMMTPSSDWGTTPCSGSQGDSTRSNGPSSSRKVPEIEKRPRALACPHLDDALARQEAVASLLGNRIVDVCGLSLTAPPPPPVRAATSPSPALPRNR